MYYLKAAGRSAGRFSRFPIRRHLICHGKPFFHNLGVFVSPLRFRHVLDGRSADGRSAWHHFPARYSGIISSAAVYNNKLLVFSRFEPTAKDAKEAQRFFTFNQTTKDPSASSGQAQRTQMSAEE